MAVKLARQLMQKDEEEVESNEEEKSVKESSCNDAGEIEPNLEDETEGD